MDDKKVILRSYPQIWNYRKMIYSFEDFKLLVPIAMEDAAFFGVGLILVALIGKIIPIFTMIPFFFRWAVLPFLVMKFLTKKKFDGKKPHKFAMGMLRFAMEPKSYSRFQPTDGIERKAIRFNHMVMRGHVIVDATSEAIYKEKKQKKGVK